MPRITPVDPTNTPVKSQPLLDAVRKQLGMTPNLMATLAHSPAALQAYLGFGQALGSATLTPVLREQIALAVAGENACSYCASAHTLLGKNAGISEEELAQNLQGDSTDDRTRAVLDFARTLVVKKGRVADVDVTAIREAGFSDAEIVEIVATVAINLFTNYFNHVADTEIDFPVVETPQPINT